MKPEDLSRLRLPSDARIGLGAGLAFVVTTPDIDRDINRKQIWIAGEEPPRPLTSGDRDSHPRWSPDGNRLAFRRAGPKAPEQVAVMPSLGGEPRLITDFAHGVEALEWAPDGSSLLVVAVTPTDEWEEIDEDERMRRPRTISEVPYRFDDKGWTHDRKRHLWLVDPEGGRKSTCLTPGTHDEEFPAWAPDSTKIAFISTRQSNPGLVHGNQVFEVAVDTLEITAASPMGHWAEVSYRSDGALHMIGSESTDYPVNWCLYRREDDGSLTNLTSELDRSSYSFAVDKTPIRWQGDEALVSLEDSGSFGVIRVDANGVVSPVIEEHGVVSSFDAAWNLVVFTLSTVTNPGEVFMIADGHTKQVTDLNSAAIDYVEPEHFRVESDGVDIDTWVYLPPGDDEVPLLLNIHGGPASQYGHGFFDEFQVYVSAGYGVVACNPRGSTGRGLDFTRAVVGDGWGHVDHADVRAVVKACLQRFDRFDPRRMGLMGGSYGGFLTAWIIGKEHNWKSAVVERGLLSWSSFAGTSDIGGTFPYTYTRETYPDGWDRWWQLSPLSLAEGVSTPTLIVHAENDFRCPIEQAEQYFMALLRNGTRTEFVRFPNEGHEMSRSGSPLHRKERFDVILDWHDRHLRQG